VSQKDCDGTTLEGMDPGLDVTIPGRPAIDGRKDDAGKLEWSLLPRLVLRPVVRVLMFGAKKYGRENWRHVPDAQRRYYDAAQRHLEAWWNDPSSRDKDTGESHLAHLVCCALFLMGLEDLE
jgi:hypothetical protein